jgi:hypothetical protein
MVRNSAYPDQYRPCGNSPKTPTREVNGAVVVSVYLVDHVLQLRLAGILAEGSHDCA